MEYIIIVSGSSLPSWFHVLPLFLIDIKPMSIQIYLPTLHYINLFGMSRCTKVTWYTLQHYKYERYISFIHSLQRTNLVLFNGFLSLFKYIYQPLNSSSTDPPPFLAWLTGHIRLRNLSTFASFRWVRCDHSKVGGASTLVRWFGYPLIIY